jgi:hypothetical protein
VAYKNPADQKRAARAHYDRNKEAYLARAAETNKRVRAEMRQFVRSAKDRPCADCGLSYPYYVMQFDHVGEKQFTIGRYSNGSTSYQRMVREVEKCEVVCANCHAERTFQRGQRYLPALRAPGPHEQPVLF